MTAKTRVFLCPFRAEAKLLTSVLPDCRSIDSNHWKFKSGEIFTWNGAGGEKLQSALQGFAGLHNFDRIVLFGAAGALAPNLEIGDIFSVSTAIYDSRRVEIAPATGFLAAETVTVDAPVLAAADRQALFSQTGAVMADMESFFLISGLPKLAAKLEVIRFISDTAAVPFSLPFSDKIKKSVCKMRKLFIA